MKKTGKKISFASKRTIHATTGNVDDWVFNRDTEQRQPEPREPMKRLTIDVPLSLHRRIKSQCALEELVMADEVRSLLEQRFPDAQQPVEFKPVVPTTVPS